MVGSDVGLAEGTPDGVVVGCPVGYCGFLLGLYVGAVALTRKLVFLLPPMNMT